MLTNSMHNTQARGQPPARIAEGREAKGTTVRTMLHTTTCTSRARIPHPGTQAAGKHAPQLPHSGCGEVHARPAAVQVHHEVAVANVGLGRKRGARAEAATIHSGHGVVVVVVAATLLGTGECGAIRPTFSRARTHTRAHAHTHTRTHTHTHTHTRTHTHTHTHPHPHPHTHTHTHTLTHSHSHTRMHQTGPRPPASVPYNAPWASCAARTR